MLNKIRDIVSKYIEVDRDQIQPASSIRDIGLNSYDFMNIIAQCEKTFSIVIPDRDIHELETVEDLMNYIERSKK